MAAHQRSCRWVRKTKRKATTDAALYGTAGGFTTFVSNAAGPIMNTYLVGLGLDKRDIDRVRRHAGEELVAPLERR